MRKTTKIVQLVHIQGPFKGEIQEFADDKITIGRNPSCTLTFPADLAIISRNHADIIKEGDRFKVVDHSANGTFVNGKRVTEAYLKDGDVLTIAQGGPKVSFLTKETDEVMETGSAPKESIAEPPPQELVQRPAASVEPAPPPPKPKHRVAPGGSAGAKEIMVPLVIQFGPTLRSYKKVPVVIGRHPNCHFHMEEPGIMDRHAEIFFSDNEYWIKDLTSRQLVSVNGVPVNLGVPLNPHDEISLTPEGPFFTFLGGGRIAQVEKRTPPAPPQAPAEGPAHEEPTPQPAGKVEKKKSFFKKVLKR